MLTTRSASTSERPAARSGQAARKAKAGRASPVTFPRFIPLKPPRLGDENSYPERAAVVHEAAERSGGRRIDARRGAFRFGWPVSGSSVSHRDGAGQYQTAHP